MSTDSGFLTIPIPDIKRIRLSISQVAPLIGLDNYGNFPRIVCEVWRRFNPEEFRELELQFDTFKHYNFRKSSV